MKRIHIQLNDLGEGSLDCYKFKKFRTIGKKGLKYPKDLTIDPNKSGTKTVDYRSREYVCDYAGVTLPCKMPYAILIWGQRGIFIHEWPNEATYAGNGGPTGGCFHLEVGDAKAVFDWVDEKTRITISYPW